MEKKINEFLSLNFRPRVAAIRSTDYESKDDDLIKDQSTNKQTVTSTLQGNKLHNMQTQNKNNDNFVIILLKYPFSN